MNMNPFLLTDFYKLTHILQYRPELRELTSYLTPRGSRLKGIEKVVFFGLSAYVHSYVVKNFNDNFFNRNFEYCECEIREVLELGLGYSDEMIDRTINAFRALHELGYLPVEINAVAEGTLVPMGVPCLEIKSTNPQFFWVGQALEASLSAAIWHPMVSATIAREYRKIARGAFSATVENGIDERTAMCDFSMRGQESNESAVNASVAWLTSMWNSSTVAARKRIKDVYTKLSTRDKMSNSIIRGLTSTEHSVMTSHACLDGGDEIPTFKYLFDLYKNVSFAAVCDSYDFWNVLTNILPNNFMKEIDERGKRGVFIGVRHDSAEPVDALCGTVPVLDEKSVMSFKEVPSYLIEDDTKLFRIIVKDLDAVHFRKSIRKNGIFDYKGQVYQMMSVDGEYLFSAFDEVGDEVGRYAILRPLNRPRTWEEKGMVETMYEIFGGSVNSKGYKVLNPGIKAVYGDSITITRAKKIYERLAAKGFAANNVSLGVGSFSFQALENEDGTLSPYTRDTFSVAVKNCHSKYKDEYGTVCERHVYKSPKNFSGKKSQKGLCRIFFNEDGELTYEDELYEADLVGKNSALIPYFKNGQEFKQNFETIRETIDEML
jgi:nicotinic acid phosphoribosyltransferase